VSRRTARPRHRLPRLEELEGSPRATPRWQPCRPVGLQVSFRDWPDESLVAPAVGPDVLPIYVEASVPVALPAEPDPASAGIYLNQLGKSDFWWLWYSWWHSNFLL
jgi:hypothetical protein